MPLSDADLDRILAKISEGATADSLESEYLDFKQQPHSKNDALKLLVDATVCFANSRGGTVVMGVANSRGGREAMMGCDLDPRIVQRRIHELTDPPLMVGSRLREHAGVALLVLDVFQSFDIHADKQGKATHRIGTDCVPLTPQEHRRLREERLPIDWSAQSTELRISHVSPRALTAARDALQRVPDDRQALALLSDEDLLRALGVMDEKGFLLRAGALLFSEEASQLPQVLYQYRQTPGGEATAVERLNYPLILAFERTMDLIWARRNVTPLTLPNGQQIEIADFPEVAVREALSNALIHRDYHLDQPVNLEHSPSAFIAISPGPLVGSVTSRNILTHASTPRNPVLAKAARMLRLAEETGRGVDRMFREMIRAGQEPPVIEDGVDYVRVVLAGGAPRTSIARFVAQLPADEREDTDSMLVLYSLCQRRTVTSADMAPVLQKGQAETELILRRMAQDVPGILELTRESQRSRVKQYRLRSDALRALGTAVRYQRRTTDEIDRKVVAHINEYGKVTNRTLQNLFDIDVWRARDILADLQTRSIITRTSEAARGPNVEYGKGERFPRSRPRRARTPKSDPPTDGKQDDPEQRLF
ncbi:ATP-binding protein [Microbacterium sp. 10M-3C3]|jgi:ATP-dependent DNA helicase RecG|uniref:ATP-binding protein n=1 Tax=Microbacterium sp. 10M-3C3 TaxID=2483401 RepID=UPI000F63290E|nr:ATP-binding protein [Microbacterium sp. 10M-3C3]